MHTLAKHLAASLAKEMVARAWRDKPDLYTFKEVGYLLGVSEDIAKQYAKAGRLVKVDARTSSQNRAIWRVPRESYHALLAEILATAIIRQERTRTE
jgi:hypothetical protein